MLPSLESERPKILHLRASNFYGSVEKLILGQVRHASRFQQVPVCYNRNNSSSEFISVLKANNFDPHVIPDRFPGDPRSITCLVRLIRQLRPQLVVSHEYKSNLYALIACALTRIPQVIYFHGHTAESGRVRLYNAIDGHVAAHAAAVLTVANHLATWLVAHRVVPERVSVVPNAVPDSAFETVSPQTPPELKGLPFIAAAGRFSHEKGFDLLIDAYKLLNSSALDTHLVIFGNGPEWSSLHRRVSRYGLARKIHFPGHIADLRPAFAAMRFLIIPSRSEGFPLVLLEAWAQASPVVATPIGELPDLIRNNSTGILANGILSEDIAAAISQALSISNLKERCGRNARMLVWDRYRFPTQVSVLEEIYSKVVSSGH